MRKFIFLVAISPFIVLLSSIIRMPISPIWYPQSLTLLFLFFLFSVVFIWDFNKPLALFLGACSFSTFFITHINSRAVILLFHLTFSCLACYGLSRIDTKGRKIILWSLLSLALLQIIWTILQSIGIDPFFSSLINIGKKETVGFSGAKDQLGTFFALTSPILAHLNPFLLAISFIGIIFSQSSFAFVAGLSSVLLYFALTDKKMFKKSLLVASFISLLFFGRIDRLVKWDFSTRLNVWRCAISSTIRGSVQIEKFNKIMIVRANPILGYGFGNFLTIFPFIPERDFNYRNEKFTHAHNDFIEIFFELGYVGLAILGLMLTSFILGFKKVNKDRELALYFCCVIAYILNAMGNFISHLAVSGMLLILYFGIYEGRRRELNGQASLAGSRASS